MGTTEASETEGRCVRPTGVDPVDGTAGLGDSLRKTAEQAVEEREAIRLAAAEAEREAPQQPRL